jgi:hypothetical protein
MLVHKMIWTFIKLCILFINAVCIIDDRFLRKSKKMATSVYLFISYPMLSSISFCRLYIVQWERPSADATTPGQRALHWFYSVRQVTRGTTRNATPTPHGMLNTHPPMCYATYTLHTRH